MSSYVDHSMRLPTKPNGAACVLLLLITYASAQTDSSPSSKIQYPYRNINASMMVIVVIFIVVFLLLALMSGFIRHCADNSGEWSSNSMLHRPSAARFWKLHRGLDTSLVESFPTFYFSEIKDRKIGNAALECAVCLNELDDGKILRLLPKCGHVFHRDCIDNWIASHSTCPVCRTDLSKNSTAGKQTGEHLVVVESRSTDIVGETENQISITISNVVVHTFPSENLKPEKEITFEKLRRSRSTGHLTSKVKRVNSCVAFSSDDEGSSEKGNRGGGEGSNKERSRRWPILQRPGSSAENGR